MISLKSLARLQFRQFFRNKNKSELLGFVFIIAYFWVVEIICYALIRDELGSLPAPILALSFLGAAVPDFLLKLVFVHDRTVQDAFLKTRPVLEDRWETFLLLSQSWMPSNLLMPLIMTPACFLFLPFGTGLFVLVLLYLLSVAGGLIIMFLKRRGDYASEKNTSAPSRRAIAADNRNGVFALQYKSLLRSRRLKTALLFLAAIFLFQFVSQVLSNPRHGGLFLFYFILGPATISVQYGLGIEANSWGCFWTRPVAIARLLESKYWLCVCCGAIAALISIPFCLWLHVSLLDPLAYFLFSTGLGGLVCLVDAYKCCPFDLFGKTFFNYQGAAGTFKASTLIGLLILIGIGTALPAALPGWPGQLILSGIGLAGFLLHKPFFRWVEQRFLRNKYLYLEKYLTK